MPEKITPQDKAKIDAVDELVLRQAKAERDHQLSLRKADNDRVVRLEEIRSKDRADRRQRRGHILVGLAIVIVIVIVIGAIWTAIDRNGARQVRENQQHEQTAQECIKAGNIWIQDGCLLANHPAGAPAPPAS
jgi:flagellar biosynthesis/type III secretory pathway M-ring protein FliF/YscJ